MKSKLLYIGPQIVNISSGADLVNKRNQTLLESFFSVSYLPFVGGKFSKLFLSVTDAYIERINDGLKEGVFEYVFISQSLMGRACKFIKCHYPQVKIITFFHNIELQYAREYMKTKGIKALPFYLAVLIWEKKTCKYADYCITLNERDSILLQRKYQRKSDLVLPTTFLDTFDEVKCRSCLANNKIIIDYLFVGVSFFANVEAVQWFLDNVMPMLKGNFFVVGKGMDKVKFKNLTSNVHVYGYVDDLSEFYYRAGIVISPIRVGGGMKTKTAEALMYGKTIIGSKEAFEGYVIDNRCMKLCNTPTDYVEAIFKLEKSGMVYNKFARELFLRFYSNEVVQNKMELFLKLIDNGK